MLALLLCLRINVLLDFFFISLLLSSFNFFSLMVLCLVKFKNTSGLMFEIISSYPKKLVYLIINF